MPINGEEFMERALRKVRHTIRKVKFLSRNSMLTKPEHFHEFFTQIFLTIFPVKSKLSTAEKSKTTTISRVFYPKKSTIFLGKSKLNFWTKNEDFEQCVCVRRTILVSLSVVDVKLSKVSHFPPVSMK